MAKRRAEEAAVVLEAQVENPKRDLLEAYTPDLVSAERIGWLWDSLSVLGQFSPEELQRLQVAVLLLILERQYLILEEIKRLSSGAGGAAVRRNGSREGFDATYFRELIAQELGEEPDEETLETLADLAGEPGRLERAIASTRRYMEQEEVEKPLGFLIFKLRSWQQEDRGKAKRYRR